MPRITFDLKGQTALVTGGTRGIGRAVARLLAEGGAKVIYTGRGPSGPWKARHVSYARLDLGDPDDIERMCGMMRQWPRLDILVNNAGMNVIAPINAIQDNDWDKILQVNLTGAMRLMREAARLMIRRRQGGRIVNMSSMYGVISRSQRGSYSASKAGLIGLTRAAALDLAGHGILVNALCPGFVTTDLTKSILSKAERRRLARVVPLGRFAKEEEIARATVFLCSRANSYMTGQAVIVDGGMTAQ